MDWMWEYYTYMSRADEAAKKFAEDVEEMALAARDAAEHLAANALYQIEVDHVQTVTFDGKMVRELLQ